MEILDIKTTPERIIISKAVKILSGGGLLIFPTETVYGLGADATNQKAVDKLLKFKGQRNSKPISIAVSDQKMAENYVELNSVAQNLYQKFLPGPLTIVSKLRDVKLVNLRCEHVAVGGRTTLWRGPTANKQISPTSSSSNQLAKGIHSLDQTVGIRIPDYPLIIKIIKAFGRPITSTSGNISAARPPWSLKDLEETTPPSKFQLIDLFLNAGQLPKRQPSTIIDTSREATEIIRQGDLSLSPNSTKVLLSSSPEQTISIAKDLVKSFTRLNSSANFVGPRTLFIALQGPLGAGKTVFAKGIAQALGITDPIRSPSYTLIREYKLPIADYRLPFTFLFHIDAWRLSSKEEFIDLGLDKMLKPQNIIILEWPQRLTSIFNDLQKKTNLVLVDIKVLSQNKRKISVFKQFNHVDLSH